MEAPEPQASALWRALLPPGIIAFETRDFRHSPALWPDERLAVSNAVPKRVEEFAAGRACARRALAELGHAPAALLRGAGRAPAWPANATGSITHSDGYCAAAVASRDAFAAIGIDAETLGRVDEAIARRICTPEEQARLSALDPERRAEAATILFSAKEAFFKCQHALGGNLNEFRNVELLLEDGAFRVTLRRPSSVSLPLEGRYAIAGGMVFTGIALSA